MRFACLGLVLLALAGVLCGCDVIDPTEDTFTAQIVNDTPSEASFDYCNGGATCGPMLWTTRLGVGQSTSTSISAGPGNLSVFVVKELGTVRCIRLDRYAKTIRLSHATSAACHPPY